MANAINTAAAYLEPRINRVKAMNRLPHDPRRSTAPPSGRWRVVHYGVMLPGVADPFRFLANIVILGTASRIPAWNNAPLLGGEPASDSAWVMTASAVQADAFHRYSIERDCDLAADGSRLRFGDQLSIDGRPNGRSGADAQIIKLAIREGDLVADLELLPTTLITHFVQLPGIYEHWGVLCQVNAVISTVADPSVSVHHSGLCTYEYARGMNLPLPIMFFTYQIINVDARTQILFTDALGPGGVPLQQKVNVRTVDGENATFTRGFGHEIHTRLSPQATPMGDRMKLPQTFTWTVADDDGSVLVTIHGRSNDDFSYGLGAGFAGSYRYTGDFRGTSIEGTGYIEWCDEKV
jgi:hypothetical protein